jgi:flavodoxin
MKVVILYDSVFGNTERIAQAMGTALEPLEEVTLLRVGDAQPEQLMQADLLIAGSPTRGFRPTPATNKLLESIPGHGLKGVKVAAFDTRVLVSEINSRILPIMVRLFGYAAEPIANKLRKKDGELVAPAEGFFVDGKEGPMKGGELERAADWARQLVTTRVTA